MMIANRKIISQTFFEIRICMKNLCDMTVVTKHYLIQKYLGWVNLLFSFVFISHSYNLPIKSKHNIKKIM